jgi:hypothetical protein
MQSVRIHRSERYNNLINARYIEVTLKRRDGRVLRMLIGAVKGSMDRRYEFHLLMQSGRSWVIDSHGYINQLIRTNGTAVTFRSIMAHCFRSLDGQTDDIESIIIDNDAGPFLRDFNEFGLEG